VSSIIEKQLMFIYELDPYPLEVYQICKNELPTWRLSKFIVWQTYIHRCSYILCRFVGGQKTNTFSELMNSFLKKIVGQFYISIAEINGLAWFWLFLTISLSLLHSDSILVKDGAAWTRRVRVTKAKSSTSSETLRLHWISQDWGLSTLYIG